jgi:hypothetical protein
MATWWAFTCTKWIYEHFWHSLMCFNALCYDSREPVSTQDSKVDLQDYKMSLQCLINILHNSNVNTCDYSMRLHGSYTFFDSKSHHPCKRGGDIYVLMSMCKMLMCTTHKVNATKSYWNALFITLGQYLKGKGKKIGSLYMYMLTFYSHLSS